MDPSATTWSRVAVYTFKQYVLMAYLIEIDFYESTYRIRKTAAHFTDRVTVAI